MRCISVTLFICLLIANLNPSSSRALQKRDDYGNAEVSRAYAEKKDPAQNAITTNQVLGELDYLSQQNVFWLTWSSPTETNGFTDLGASDGQNYGNCGANTTAVGVRCKNTKCNTISLFCAALESSEGSTISFNLQNVPAYGDAMSINNFSTIVGYINDDINPNSRACPPNTTANGVSCVDTDCKFMGLYCAAPINQSQNLPVYIATPNPSYTEYGSNVNTSQICTWEESTSSSNKGDTGSPAMCPPNKVLAGLQAEGERSTSLKVYCCPAYQYNSNLNAADIQVSSSSNVMTTSSTFSSATDATTTNALATTTNIDFTAETTTSATDIIIAVSNTSATDVVIAVTTTIATDIAIIATTTTIATDTAIIATTTTIATDIAIIATTTPRATDTAIIATTTTSATDIAIIATTTPSATTITLNIDATPASSTSTDSNLVFIGTIATTSTTGIVFISPTTVDNDITVDVGTNATPTPSSTIGFVFISPTTADNNDSNSSFIEPVPTATSTNSLGVVVVNVTPTASTDTYSVNGSPDNNIANQPDTPTQPIVVTPKCYRKKRARLIRI